MPDNARRITESRDSRSSSSETLRSVSGSNQGRFEVAARQYAYTQEGQRSTQSPEQIISALQERVRKSREVTKQYSEIKGIISKLREENTENDIIVRKLSNSTLDIFMSLMKDHQEPAEKIKNAVKDMQRETPDAYKKMCELLRSRYYTDGQARWQPLQDIVDSI